MTLEEEVVALRADVAAWARPWPKPRHGSQSWSGARRKTPRPAFVRPDTPTERPAQPRKKRAPEHNVGRRRTRRWCDHLVISHRHARRRGGLWSTGGSRR